MKVRNITAAIICGLMIALCCCVACSASNLKVECQDDKVSIYTTDKVTTSAMGSFRLEENQSINLDYAITDGYIDLAISHAYTGQTVYSERIEGNGSDIVGATIGEYVVSIDTTNMTGSVEISAKPVA